MSGSDLSVAFLNATRCTGSRSRHLDAFAGLKPNSITLASSEIAPNMFAASSELVPNMLASSELAPNMFGASSQLVRS